MARGRQPIVLNKEEFQAALSTLEASKEFQNRSDLWAAFAETEYARSRTPIPLKPQTAMAKADALGLLIKTPKGKKGKLPGERPPSTGRKKKNINPEYRIDILNGMPDDQKIKLAKVVDRASSGSMKAAIKLKCLDCTNYQKSEISRCTIVGCGLHPYRPYRNALNVVDIEKEDEDAEEVGGGA